MQLLVLYRPDSEHSTELERYLKELVSLHPDIDVSMVDYDSVDGVQKAQIYGLVQQPALVIVDSEGKMIASWAGETLPLMDEVAAYSGV